MSNGIKIAGIGVIRHPRLPDHILISQRLTPDNPEEHLKWQLPGGSIKHGEYPLHATFREICEETGMDVGNIGDRPYMLSAVLSSGAHALMFVYEFQATSSDIPPNPEPDISTDWGWVDVNSLGGLYMFLAFDMLHKEGYFKQPLSR